jgi:hypothetical protein
MEARARSRPVFYSAVGGGRNPFATSAVTDNTRITTPTSIVSPVHEPTTGQARGAKLEKRVCLTFWVLIVIINSGRRGKVA